MAEQLASLPRRQGSPGLSTTSLIADSPTVGAATMWAVRPSITDYAPFELLCRGWWASSRRIGRHRSFSPDLENG